MFTGIITHIGEVVEINFNDKKDCLIAIFINKKIDRKLEIGCSIACNGICLTLIKKNKNILYFQASKESCDITSITKWNIGKKINIEFALRAGDEMGGHIVNGHIDGCAELKSMRKIKESKLMIFSLTTKSKKLSKFLITKGSICVDGVSLTINKVDNSSFSVNIIKHTAENTILNQIKLGDLVNIEIDLLAKIYTR